jgi:hypothetical protein
LVDGFSLSVLACHGCDQSLAERVIAAGQGLRPSANEWDWLGHGLYFWEDNHDRALRWAQDASKTKASTVKKPAAVGAVIDLGNCLNLVDSKNLGLVKAAHTESVKICQTVGTPEARNRGPDFRARYLDCSVMETLHKLREQKKLEPFETVRGFFVEGRELYPGAGLRELDHIQICVRSPKRIMGYFKPRNV